MNNAAGESMRETIGRPKERFAFIDGLRALAALGVMFHHLFCADLQGPLEKILPAPVRWLFVQDLQRVQVFFVISGFVIAWSLRNMTVTGSSALNFILRRQIRLDPVYWFCLLAGTLHLVLQVKLHPEYVGLVPSWRNVLFNAAYLQDILHRPTVLYVSWTLCLEVQLYLVYIVLLYLIQRTVARLKPRRQNHVRLALMAPLLALSIFVHTQTWAQPYFLRSWYLFAMGVMVCWTMEKRISPLELACVGSLLIGISLWRQDEKVFFCPAIAATIYVAGLTGGLTVWLKQRFIQYFGRISYSLFLVHWDVGKATLRLGTHFGARNPSGALLWFSLAILASIAVAHLLHITLERPSMNLAARLKGRPTSRTSPALAAANPS